MRLFIWLGGSCWNELSRCPVSERVRLTALGATVLVPTALALFGMYFYVHHRYPDMAVALCLLVSVVWSLIILTIDRSLLANYRPFLPFSQKAGQVFVRFLLAGIVSVAISFPFCLDQFKEAIRNRYQVDYEPLIKEFDAQWNKTEKEAAGEWKDTKGEIERRIIELQETATKFEGGPEGYADQLIEAEKEKARNPDNTSVSGQLAALKQHLAALTKTLQDDRQSLEIQKRAKERVIVDKGKEIQGVANGFANGAATTAGQGPRYRQLLTDEEGIDKELLRLNKVVPEEQTQVDRLSKEIGPMQEADTRRQIDELDAKRASIIADAREKKKRLEEDLKDARTELEDATKRNAEDQAERQKFHDDTRAEYKRKQNADLDIMEQTIGLFRVIFTPPREADAVALAEQPYKRWAGLIAFGVVFFTLFTLDLMPIVVKIFSRPGPYDCVIEEREFIAETNLRALRNAYPAQAYEWAVQGARVEGAIFDRQYPRPPEYVTGEPEEPTSPAASSPAESAKDPVAQTPETREAAEEPETTEQPVPEHQPEPEEDAGPLGGTAEPGLSPG